MLIKVTNFCSMGCTHCMEDSTIAGAHMTLETFSASLEFTRRVEAMAWLAGARPQILLSGGECTEHPDIVKMVETVVAEKLLPILITNGSWLANAELRAALLRPEWKNLRVQVTNDKRFYPTAIERVEDPRITYIDQIVLLNPMGRAARKRSLPVASGVPVRSAPSSFNLRSMTRSFQSFEVALAYMRVRSCLGVSMTGQCSPSICENGDLVAGESRGCFKIGTIASSSEDITRALSSMKCNRCGLVDNLTQEQKRAINEANLFLAGEP